MEYITRIKVNGVRKELTLEEAKMVVQKRVREALEAMNYEKKAG